MQLYKDGKIVITGGPYKTSDIKELNTLFNKSIL